MPERCAMSLVCVRAVLAANSALTEGSLHGNGNIYNT